jgi:hypothetical protein
MASEQHRALDHFFVAERVFSCAYIQATNMTIALKHPVISAAQKWVVKTHYNYVFVCPFASPKEE